MHAAPVLERLLRTPANVNGEIYVPYEDVKEELYTIERTVIQWDTADFRYIAEWKKGEKWRDYFDESKFEEALHKMILDHDAEIGISWTVVTIYLNLYCKKLPADPPFTKKGDKAVIIAEKDPVVV